jgi:hypothetical protein
MYNVYLCFGWRASDAHPMNGMLPKRRRNNDDDTHAIRHASKTVMMPFSILLLPHAEWRPDYRDKSGLHTMREFFVNLQSPSRKPTHTRGG